MRISCPTILFALMSVAAACGSPPPPVTALAYAPDAKLLGAGVYREVVLLDPAGAEVVTTLGGVPGPVMALAYSPDGRRIVLADGVPGKPAELRIYPVTGGRPAPTPAHTLTV